MAYRPPDERVTGGANLPNPLPDERRRLARLRPPPPPKLNVGGKNDSHRIRFMPWNPKHPVRHQRSTHPAWTNGAAIEPIRPKIPARKPRILR